MTFTSILYIAFYLIMALSIVSCGDKLPNCGISEEIWSGLEEIENLVSPYQLDKTPDLIEELYSKHPPSSLEELSLKYEHLIKFYFYDGQTDMIRRYVDSLERLSDPDDSDCYRGRATYLFAKAYLVDKSGGSLLEIIQLHEEGKKYNSRFVEECRVKLIPFTLARIYGRQQHYDEAINYLKEELLQMEDCQRFTSRYDFANLQALLNSIGVYYERMNKLDSAEVYYSRALDFVQEHKASTKPDDNFANLAEAVIKGNLGGIFLGQGKYDLAEQYFIASIEVTDQPDMDPGDALLTKIKLLDLYDATNRKQDALSLLDDINSDALLGVDIESEVRLSTFASRFFSRQGDYEQALYWKERQRVAEIEKFNQFDLQRTRDVEEKIDLINQQFSYDILERKNTLKTRTIWGISVMGLLLILLVSLLAVNRRDHKRHIENLSVLNEKVSSKNRELLVSLRDLQVSQEENKKLMRVLAHDLRTPIASIVNLSDLLLTPDLSQDEIHEMVNLQKRSAHGLLSLINDLLTPGINSNREKSLVNMKDLVANCITTLTPLASDKSISIQLEGESVSLMGYREKLWRLVSNLLSNAIKFSYEESAINVYLIDKGGSLEMRIQDKGIGIPEEQLDTIFSMSAVDGRPGTQGEQSFGMGLTICKQIVDMHDGVITCNSEVGQGTVFIVELPLGDL